MQAGGVAVFDPVAWFGAMSVATALRWSRFYAIEPWGNKEAGLRTGMLAAATGQASQEISVEDFIVSAPTRREAAEIAEWERQAAEFDSWKRHG